MLEDNVVQHYTRGAVGERILTMLCKASVDIERFDPDALGPLDELHLGWKPATVEIGAALGIGAGDRVLDVGCGIGGPARHFAHTHGAQVDGIDITAEFLEVARDLTRRCGLAERITFTEASGLALPFEPAAFDAATMLHVGMNIEDKAGVYREVRRVLKPGGRFAVYDAMRVGDGELVYPMPWALTPATSFVERPATYCDLLTATGFEIVSERSRLQSTLELAAKLREDAAAGRPLTPDIFVSPDRRDRLDNIMAMLEGGTLAPVEIVARAS